MDEIVNHRFEKCSCYNILMALSDIGTQGLNAVRNYYFPVIIAPL